MTTALLAYALGYDKSSAIKLGEAGGRNDNDPSRNAESLWKQIYARNGNHSLAKIMADCRKYHFPTNDSMPLRWDEFKANPTLDTWGNLLHNRQEWEFKAHRNNLKCFHTSVKDDYTRLHLAESYGALWATKDMIENHAARIREQGFLLSREAEPLSDYQLCAIFDVLFRADLEMGWDERHSVFYNNLFCEIDRKRSSK